MSRQMHRSPRHLDDPLKVLGFTLAQWLVLALAALVLWACLALIPDVVPATFRLSLGAAVIGLPLGITFAPDTTRPLFELPRRAAHGVVTPSDYLPGSPRHGALRFVTFVGMVPKEDMDA